MPDISMCPNSNCEGRGDCFRYLAEPSAWRQAYAMFEPKEGEKVCNVFLDVKLWNGYRIRSVKQADNSYMNKQLTERKKDG